MKWLLILPLVAFCLPSAQAQNLGSELIRLEKEMQINLKDAQGETAFRNHLARWESLVDEVKEQPYRLEQEIHDVQMALEANLAQHQSATQFQNLLETLNQLRNVQAKIGLAILQLPDSSASVAHVEVMPPAVSQSSDFSLKKNSLQALTEMLDQPDSWDHLRQSVLDHNTMIDPSYALLYPGSTGTEIIASGKTFAAEIVRTYNLHDEFETGALRGRMQLDRFALGVLGQSNVNLIVGQLNISKPLRSSAAADRFEQSVQGMLSVGRVRVNQRDLFSRKAAIDLKMALLPVLFMAEALDVAQLTHDPAEGEVRLAFEYCLKDFIQKVIGKASFATNSHLVSIAEAAFSIITSALRTPENKIYLSSVAKSIQKTLLPSGYSEAKWNLPLKDKWIYFLDLPSVIKQVVVYRGRAGLIQRISQAIKCEDILAPPTLRSGHAH